MKLTPITSLNYTTTTIIILIKLFVNYTNKDSQKKRINKFDLNWNKLWLQSLAESGGLYGYNSFVGRSWMVGKWQPL